MEEFRQRFSPLVVVCHDEYLNQIYLPNSGPSSFTQCLKKTEKFNYTISTGASGQSRHLFIRIAGANSVQSYSNDNYFHYLEEKWSEIEAKKVSLEDTIEAMSASCMDGVWQPKAYTTIDHPVACIHAVSADNSDALKWLLDSQQNLLLLLEPLSKKAISSDILHYFVLVRSAETVGGYRDTHVNELFSAMCRHFGHNTAQIIIHSGKIQDQDMLAWEGLMRSFVAQSLAVFMQNFVNSGTQAANSIKSPMAGLGFAGKLFSAGRKWLVNSSEGSNSLGSSFDSSEFLTRRAADFSVLIGDWTEAQSIIDSLIDSVTDSKVSMVLQLLRILLLVAQQKPLDDLYRDIESLLSLGEKAIDSSIECASFVIRLFKISTSLPEDLKLAIMIHLTKLINDELEALAEIVPIKFESAAFVLKDCTYKLNNKPDPVASLTLLDKFGSLMTKEEQGLLIETLRMHLGPAPIHFLSVEPSNCFFTTCAISSSPKPCDFDSARAHLAEICNGISLALTTRINVECLWMRHCSMSICDSEVLLLTVFFRNHISVPLTLSSISLQVLTSDGNLHTMAAIDDLSVTIGSQNASKTMLRFMPEFTGKALPNLILATINGVAPISLPFNPPCLKPSENSRLCVDRRVRSPRLQIDVEGVSSITFNNQEIQATVVVWNTGTVLASNVILFSSGIDSFPAKGLPLGDITPGASIEVPISFQVDILDANRIAILAAEADDISNGVFWNRTFTPQLSFTVNTIVTESVLLLSVKNVSEHFLLNYCPVMCSSDGAEITSQPDRLDIPPTHTSIFAFLLEPKKSRMINPASDLSINAECYILGDLYRFSHILNEEVLELLKSAKLLDSGKEFTTTRISTTLNLNAARLPRDLDRSEDSHNPWRPRELGKIPLEVGLDEGFATISILLPSYAHSEKFSMYCGD